MEGAAEDQAGLQVGLDLSARDWRGEEEGACGASVGVGIDVVLMAMVQRRR